MIEETNLFKPCWNENGLMPTIVQDATSLEVLMLTYMNEESLQLTLQSGEAIYWSQSKQKLWRTSEVSRHKQKIRDMRIDCAQGAFVVLVDTSGDMACHTHRPSCFYRMIESDQGQDIFLRKMERYQHRLTLDQIAFQQNIIDAMENGDLYLLFQPQIDLQSGAIVGAEALLRWQQDGKIIMPNDFLPMVESVGLMHDIGRFVLRRAIELGARLRNETKTNIRISVNVSTTQFSDTALVPCIKEWLAEYHFPSGLLEIEITESVLLEDLNVAISWLKELHALGVQIAMDDFGTGYSSLSYLRQLPINRIKVDQSFVRDALTNADDRIIARTIIALGKALNLKTIAEGVESEGIERFLLKENCDEAQGFYYSSPLSFADIVTYIRTKDNQNKV
jgi:EAL domain-containing protein (putative c-di-GMP-specific phosphodiesterase class I)/phosphoribosyl-AMP cyclohydrolase